MWRVTRQASDMEDTIESQPEGVTYHRRMWRVTRQTVNIEVTTESQPERVADVAILILGRQDVHAGCRKPLTSNRLQSTPCTTWQFQSRMYTSQIAMQDVHITEHIYHRRPWRTTRQTVGMEVTIESQPERVTYRRRMWQMTRQTAGMEVTIESQPEGVTYHKRM